MGWDVYALLGLGTALAVVRLVPLVGGALNSRLFLEQIEKLVRAGKRDRAITLCKAAPKAYVARVTRAVLEASAGAGAGLHARDSLDSAFDRARKEETARVHKNGWLGPLGAVLALAGAAMALGAKSADPSLAAAALPAVILAIAGHRKRARTEADLRTVADKLMPLL